MPHLQQCLLLLQTQKQIGKPFKQRKMKKIYTLAALAMVAIVACNKSVEITEENIPVDEPKKDVTIMATSASETKTTVDGLQVKWSSGDHIAVFDADNDKHDFSLDDGAGTTTGKFSGSLSGKNSGGWAVYPFTTNAAFDGSEFHVDYATTYSYDAVTVPMYGSEGTGANAGKYEFDHVGGAFKIQYTNVPAGTDSFVFTSTGDDFITGTATFDLTDSAILDGGKVVTVNNLPSSTSLTFIIPVPATATGTAYTFNVKLKKGDDVVLGSDFSVTSAKTVAVGHVKPLKAIAIPIYYETFGSTSSNTAFGSYSGYSAITSMFTTSEVINTHYTGNGQVGKNNLSDVNLSNGYAGASGLSGCWLTAAKADVNVEKTIVQVSNINISGYNNLSLSFGALGGNTSHKVNVSYIIDSGSETSLITNGSLSNTSWTLLSQSIPSTGSSLTLIFKHTPTKQWTIRLDDIKVTGTPIP